MDEISEDAYYYEEINNFLFLAYDYASLDRGENYKEIAKDIKCLMTKVDKYREQEIENTVKNWKGTLCTQ